MAGKSHPFFETHLPSLCCTVIWSLTELPGLTILKSLKLLAVDYQSKVKINNFRHGAVIKKYTLFSINHQQMFQSKATVRKKGKKSQKKKGKEPWYVGTSTIRNVGPISVFTLKIGKKSWVQFPGVAVLWPLWWAGRLAPRWPSVCLRRSLWFSWLHSALRLRGVGCHREQRSLRLRVRCEAGRRLLPFRGSRPQSPWEEDMHHKEEARPFCLRQCVTWCGEMRILHSYLFWWGTLTPASMGR